MCAYTDLLFSLPIRLRAQIIAAMVPFVSGFRPYILPSFWIPPNGSIVILHATVSKCGANNVCGLLSEPETTL